VVSEETQGFLHHPDQKMLRTFLGRAMRKGSTMGKFSEQKPLFKMVNLNKWNKTGFQTQDWT
jgi:hypothetical protein